MKGAVGPRDRLPSRLLSLPTFREYGVQSIVLREDTRVKWMIFPNVVHAPGIQIQTQIQVAGSS